MRGISSASPDPEPCDIPPVGAGLLRAAFRRRRRVSRCIYCLIHRLREQARSHIGYVSVHKKCVHTNVTIGAICVCTFSFSAPKSYISVLITSPTSSLSKNKYLFKRSI